MEIDAHFVKTSDFKTVPVSGAYGGPLGNGLLNLNLFIERGPIPQKVTMEIKSDGTVIEKNREGKSGVVREVSFGILMDLSASKAIYSLLGEMITEQEKIVNHRILQK